MQRITKKSLIVLILILTMSTFILICVVSQFRKVNAGLNPESEVYAKLKVFTEAISFIRNNYVEEVEDKDLIFGAIRGMLKDVDFHSYFLTPDMYSEMQVDTRGKFEGVGIEITINEEGRLIVVSPLEGTPAYKMGLQAQDWIIKIDGESTKDFTLMEAVKRIRGKKGTPVVLTIVREGLAKPKDFEIIRGVIKTESVTSEIYENSIGYIRIRQFQERTAQDVAKALKKIEADKLDGLILDVRNNPGGLLNIAIDLADHFLEKGKIIVSTKGRIKDADEVYKARHDPLIKGNIPIVVLTNAGSASASEILAGALRDHNRGLILGTRTFGKGSVQTIYTLSDGSAIRLTTAKYYTPNGTSIHGKGIDPDIMVEKLSAADKERIISEENVIREKDLLEMEKKGHRNNNKDELEDEKQEKEDKEEKNKDSGMKTIEDLQLQRAIDVIKATKILHSQLVSK
ncbi:MAG: S41 family peptidase [bacterium]